MAAFTARGVPAGTVLALTPAMLSTDGTGSRSSPRDESTTDLVVGLLTDAKDLAAAHADQLKLEFRTEVRSLMETIKLTGVAIAAVVLAGLLLGQAAALGLSAATGLPAWASFAAVGALAAVAGYLTYRSRPAAVDLVPSAAISSLKRDVERVSDVVSP